MLWTTMRSEQQTLGTINYYRFLQRVGSPDFPSHRCLGGMLQAVDVVRLGVYAPLGSKSVTASFAS